MLLGFGVGLFWLVMAFLFFSGGTSVFTDILFNGLAVITCPSLLVGHNYLAAPVWNALVYGLVASAWQWMRKKRARPVEKRSDRS